MRDIIYGMLGGLCVYAVIAVIRAIFGMICDLTIAICECPYHCPHHPTEGTAD